MQKILSNTCVALLLIAAIIAVTARSVWAKDEYVVASNFDRPETGLAIVRALDDLAQLKEKLAIAEATAARMSENMAIVNAEAEVFRRQSQEVKLRFEAVGVDTANADTQGLERRLLQAVSNFRLSEDRRRRIVEAASGLSVAVTEFTRLIPQNKVTAEAQVCVEKQQNEVQRTISDSSEYDAERRDRDVDITEGLVIGVREELALIVANLGSHRGGKVGMPLHVVRQNRVIGSIRLIDLRDQVAGAVVQNLERNTERIQVGDRLVVAASQ